MCAKEGSNVVTPLVSHTNTGPINMDVTLKASDQLDAHKSQNYSACGQTALPCKFQLRARLAGCARLCCSLYECSGCGHVSCAGLQTDSISVVSAFPPDSVQAQTGTTSSVTAIRRSNVVAPVFHHANVSGGLNLNIKMTSGSSEAQGIYLKSPESVFHELFFNVLKWPLTCHKPWNRNHFLSSDLPKKTPECFIKGNYKN